MRVRFAVVEQHHNHQDQVVDSLLYTIVSYDAPALLKLLGLEELAIDRTPLHAFSILRTTTTTTHVSKTV